MNAVDVCSVILCLPSQWVAWGEALILVDNDAVQYCFPVGLAGEYILGKST